jgi:hypothetical protein
MHTNHPGLESGIPSSVIRESTVRQRLSSGIDDMECRVPIYLYVRPHHKRITRSQREICCLPDLTTSCAWAIPETVLLAGVR